MSTPKTDQAMQDAPRFIAVTFDGENIGSDDNLGALLDALHKTYDSDQDEELVVWRDAETVAAVVRRDGSVALFEEIVPPVPAVKVKTGNRKLFQPRPQD